jgi:translation elongation factor EF-1alpha
VGDCCSVKVESGVIREKDKLILQPQEVEVEVKAIEVHKKKVEFAYSG